MGADKRRTLWLRFRRSDGPQADVASSCPGWARFTATSEWPSRADGNPVCYRFQIAIIAHAVVSSPASKTREFKGRTELTYSWQWRNNEADLVLHSMGVNAVMDGKPEKNAEFSCARIRRYDGSKTVDEPYETARPQVQRMLRQQFETVLVRRRGTPTVERSRTSLLPNRLELQLRRPYFPTPDFSTSHFRAARRSGKVVRRSRWAKAGLQPGC